MVEKENVMARRGENIHKRTDGRWEGRYMLSTPTGRKQRSVYAKTYAKVKEKLAVAKETAKKESFAIDAESGRAGRKTFGVMAEEWLQYIEKNRKYPTYVKYKKIYEKYLSELAKVPLTSVDVGTIDKKLTLLGMQESVALKRTVYAVFNQIMKYAAKKYHVHADTFQMELGCERKQNVETFSQMEQSRLFHVLCSEMDVFKMGILLCLSTGLRLGEICALKCSDIDLHTETLRVSSTVQRIAVDGCGTKTILYENKPKSIYSMREIPLSEDVVQLLRSFPMEGEYLIKRDAPMEPRTYQNKLKSYLRQAEIGNKSFHALRHTFATNCIESGMDAKSLSEILGHANVQITLNRYVHPSIALKRQQMNKLSSIYGQFVGQSER